MDSGDALPPGFSGTGRGKETENKPVRGGRAGDEEMHQDMEDEPIESTQAPRRKIFGPDGSGRRTTGRGQPMDSGDALPPGFSGTGMGKETENKPVRGGRAGDEEMHQDMEDEPIESTQAPRRKIFGPDGCGRRTIGRGQPIDSGDGLPPGFSGTVRGKETENKPVREGRAGDEEMHQDMEDEPIESTQAPRRKIFGPDGCGRRIIGRGQPMDSGDGLPLGFSGTGRDKETENKPIRGRAGGRGNGPGNDTVN